MNYKETLFFVGKCLTISHEEHNRKIVEQEIKPRSVDWDNVVKLSTEHYVFPALYCNLKRANLLSYLPEELVNYMKHITDLNRERNLQIIEQAKEINELLLANSITPIFLKGTAFLLQKMYEDTAERMVGDIDFIVAQKDFEKAIKIMNNDGYFSKDEKDYNIIPTIHYPKMVTKGKIVAIEIHQHLIIPPYNKRFDYDFIADTVLLTNGVHVLSIENEIIHNCINKQISDRGMWYKSIALRNSYDLFLLSNQKNSKKVLENYPFYKNLFNIYLGISKSVFNSESLSFTNNTVVQKKLNQIIFFTSNSFYAKLHYKFWKLYFIYKSRLILLKELFYKRNTRKWFANRISSKNWWLYKFGLKSNP